MARLRKAPTKALRDQFTSYSPNETLDKDKCATKPQIEPRSSATRKTNHVETIVIYDSDEEEKEHSYAKEEEERKEGLKYLDLSAEEADTDESQSADRADDYGLGNESDDNDHDAEKAISQLEEAIETTTLKLKKKRTLRPLRVNRVNTQIQSRRVSTREVSRYNEYLSDDENMSAGSGDYEKENDEKGLFNETKSSARRKSRLSELRRRSGRNSRMPSLSTQYLSEGDGEDRSADDEEFDSLDDFIVGDDEDISYFESAEENDEESEDEIIVKPKTPGRRLLRGRKPSSPRENSSTQNNTKVNPNIGVNIDNAHDSSDVDGLIDILHHTTLSKPEPQTTQVINRKPQKSLKGRKYKPKAMKFDNDDDGSNAPS